MPCIRHPHFRELLIMRRQSACERHLERGLCNHRPRVLRRNSKNLWPSAVRRPSRRGPLGNAAHSVAASVGFTPLPVALDGRETQPCFIVRDANGRPLAFVYCEDEPGRPSSQNLEIIE